MPNGHRDPFREDPRPPFVEVDAVAMEEAWEGGDDARNVCPGCDAGAKGHFAERGTAPSNDQDWVAFTPCGHIVVLAGWAIY